MTIAGAPLAVGDVVKALYERDGAWYTAEIAKVLKDEYQVAWYDGMRKSLVPFDKVRKISIDTAKPHLFGMRDRVLVPFDDGAWYSGIVIGLFDKGYHVQWDNRTGKARVLEGETHGFPKALAGDQHVPIGSKVLGLYDIGEWYPATVTAIFPDGYSLEWEDGKDSVRLPGHDVLTKPNDLDRGKYAQVRKSDDASMENRELISERKNDLALETNDSVLDAFKKYFETRLNLAEIELGKISEAGFCPNCDTHHIVQWFNDKRYNTRFFLCNVNSHPGVGLQQMGNRRTERLSPRQLMTEYTSMTTLDQSVISKIIERSKVQISIVPPFVTISITGSPK